MSAKKLSFIVWCIELYAAHKSMLDVDVYKYFLESGLLSVLKEDYGDLHSMSFEYLMGYFDEYLEAKK